MNLSDYSDQEFWGELKRRGSSEEALRISNLDIDGYTTKDFVVKYGFDKYDFTFKFSFYILKNGRELNFYCDFDAVDKSDFIPTKFYECMENVYESEVSLDESLEFLRKCGYERFVRDEEMFNE